MSDTKPITVYEYLRPENTMEKKDYYLPADCVDIAKRLADRDIHPCCDIYPNGECAVYLYSNSQEVVLNRLGGQQHSTADVAMSVLLRSFDFSSVSYY